MIIKTKVFKILILCIILNIVIFSVFYYIYKQIVFKNQKIMFVSSEVNNASEKESKISNIKKEIKLRGEDKTKLDSNFINVDSVADFFNEIENLGKQVGVSVELGNADFSKDKKRRLQLSFSIVGSFDAVNKFTYLLENFKYEFEEKKVILSKNTTDLMDSMLVKNLWKGQYDIDLVSFVSQ